MTGSGPRLMHVPAVIAAWLLRRPWLFWGLGGGALLLLATVPFATDLIVLNRATVDFSYPLDTALKWAFGHWPHRDYQTPVGIAYWLLQGLAGALLDLSAKAIFLANLIAAALIGLAGAVLVRRRLAPSHAAILMTGLLALVLSPRMFGDPAGLISYLAPYNKTGLAILGVLFTAQFVSRRDGARSGLLGVEPLVAGLLIAWLIFLKLNFAALAVVGGIAALYFAPENRRGIVGSFLVAGIVTALVAATTGIGGAYLADIRTVSTVGDVFRTGKLAADVVGSLLTLALFAAALVAYRISSRSAAWPRSENLIVAVGLFTACLAAMNQVHGHELPLVFVALIVLAERALREAPSDRDMTYVNAAPMLAALFLVLLPVAKDLETMRLYVTEQTDGNAIRFCHAPEVPACTVSYAFFDAHALRTLAPFPKPALGIEPASPEDIANYTRDAKDIAAHLNLCRENPLCALWSIYSELYGLLNLVMVQDDRAFMLGFMNPVPYYYGIEPPKDVPAWIDMGRTVSEDVHPDAAIMFSDVTLLIVPKTELAQDYRPGLFAIYEDDIRARFALVAETESWSIWRKRP